MNNERPTKDIVTPISKQTVSIVTYVTGRDKRALRNIYLMSDISDSDRINMAQDLSWKTVVVAIDGKKDGEVDIVDSILSMNATDTAFIVKEVDRVTADLPFEEKKTN